MTENVPTEVPATEVDPAEVEVEPTPDPDGTATPAEAGDDTAVDEHGDEFDQADELDGEA